MKRLGLFAGAKLRTSIVFAAFSAGLPAQDPSTPVPGPPELPNYGDALVRMAGAFGVFIVLGFLALKLARSFRSGRKMSAGRFFNVVESVRLEPGKSLYLIKAGDQHFILGSCQTQMVNLSDGVLVVPSPPPNSIPEPDEARSKRRSKFPLNFLQRPELQDDSV